MVWLSRGHHWAVLGPRVALSGAIREREINEKQFGVQHFCLNVSVLGASWRQFLGPLGERLGCILEASGGRIGSSFWASWGPPGSLLGGSWGPLGASWRLLERLGSLVGASWGLLGAPVGLLGAPWGGPCAILGASWKIVKLS